jgi:pantothenate kinase
MKHLSLAIFNADSTKPALSRIVTIDENSFQTIVASLRDNGVSSAADPTSMNTVAKLIFFCGKMAAGKSTLARDLASRRNAVLLVEVSF